MQFSERTAWELGASAFANAVESRRRAGDLIDLTASNPTHCGFVIADADLAELSAPNAAIYDPHPLGARVAREAVAAYYRDHGATVSCDRICMTTGTSEAYSFLFRLLCDPGDTVLVARPSYPLFDFIARLDSVRLREFPMLCDPSAPTACESWSIDFATLAAAVDERTRAIILVHPNNPTGTFASEDERRRLDAFCAQRGLALVVDEVFLDYAVESTGAPTFATGEGDALCFVLSGISKVCALPQMKASWIVARGPEQILREAMERLEIIADTYLSMNAPIQHALPGWLAGRERVQSSIRDRLRSNLQRLDRRLRGSLASRLSVAAGWTVVLRVPRYVHDLAFAEAALAQGVLVQPGEFYGLGSGHIVLSLLTPPEQWDAGLAKLPI